MFATSAALRGLCVLGTLFLLPALGEKVMESGPGMVHELRTTLADMAGEGKSYLRRLVGEESVLEVLEASSQAVRVVAGGLSAGLNVLLQYVSLFLQAAGIHGSSPVKVTPEGLIFVAQWALVALVGYWLFSLALRLVASTLRQVLWLLKVSVALVCFGLILRDHSVGTETMAIRLAVLVLVCVLLGIGTSRGSSAANKTAHLEEQVKILERRLRDLEKWKRTEE